MMREVNRKIGNQVAAAVRYSSIAIGALLAGKCAIQFFIVMTELL